MLNYDTELCFESSGFVFKLINSLSNKLILEVFQVKDELDAVDFYKYIMDRDEINFILSTVLKYPIIGKKGYIEINEDTGRYVLMLELEICDGDAVLENITTDDRREIYSKFHPDNIRDIPITVSESLYEIDRDCTMTDISKRKFMMMLSVSAPSESITLENIHDKFIRTTEEYLAMCVCSNPDYDITFSKTYISVSTGESLSACILFKIDKINGIKFLEFSTEEIIMEKTESISTMVNSYILTLEFMLTRVYCSIFNSRDCIDYPYDIKWFDVSIDNTKCYGITFNRKILSLSGGKIPFGIRYKKHYVDNDGDFTIYKAKKKFKLPEGIKYIGEINTNSNIDKLKDYLNSDRDLKDKNIEVFSKYYDRSYFKLSSI